jgi:glutamate decarboxylase
MICFVGFQSHYSVERAVAILGIGTKQVRLVPVDKHGKLDPERLEQMVQKSISDREHPFLLALTAGTTVLGIMCFDFVFLFRFNRLD